MFSLSVDGKFHRKVEQKFTATKLKQNSDTDRDTTLK